MLVVRQHCIGGAADSDLPENRSLPGVINFMPVPLAELDTFGRRPGKDGSRLCAIRIRPAGELTCYG